MRHHKKCDKCKTIGTVGVDVNPYYESDKGIEWRCKSCANAEMAKTQRKLKKGVA